MKFLYEENQEYATTHELFSQEEIRAHIDRYFKDSRAYLQPTPDREPLKPHQGRRLVLICVPLAVIAAGLLAGFLTQMPRSSAPFLDRVSRWLAYADTPTQTITALLCAVFGLASLGALLGVWTLLQAVGTPDAPEVLKAAQKEKHDHLDHKGKDKKDKGKKSSATPQPRTRRDIAFEELIGRGRLMEGKISEIVELEPPLRQIRFTYADAHTNGVQSGFYITESETDLPLYETLVVLTNGEFTVLL